MMKPLQMALLPLALLVLAGCATVRRVDTNTVTDLSGNWNDTDSRLVAEDMITDCLARPWLSGFNASHNGKKPVVIVGTIANRSDEHIATDTFINDLQRELINNGKVSFVESKGERGELREEREDQQSNARAETVKRLRQETGADYMLQGTISTITDEHGGEQAKYYQVDLQLVDLESSEKVWLNTKKIKKMVSRGMFGG
jgi:uncharacterized protein (TIGR02722 family)